MILFLVEILIGGGIEGGDGEVLVMGGDDEVVGVCVWLVIGEGRVTSGVEDGDENETS